MYLFCAKFIFEVCQMCNSAEGTFAQILNKKKPCTALLLHGMKKILQQKVAYICQLNKYQMWAAIELKELPKTHYEVLYMWNKLPLCDMAIFFFFFNDGLGHFPHHSPSLDDYVLNEHCHLVKSSLIVNTYLLPLLSWCTVKGHTIYRDHNLMWYVQD